MELQSDLVAIAGGQLGPEGLEDHPLELALAAAALVGALILRVNPAVLLVLGGLLGALLLHPEDDSLPGAPAPAAPPPPPASSPASPAGGAA